MCRERKRTRDLLLDYDFTILPARPRSAGLAMVYPWENLALSTLSKQILTIARNYGFEGDEDAFWERFATGAIQFGTLDTFPIPGDEHSLYFDKETDILYYFREANAITDPDAADKAGAQVVGEDGDTLYIYIPIRALPIEPMFLDCGTAADYING